MYEGGPNPSKLQNNAQGAKLPLVLIHDGSGTTFGYHFLGDLGRDTWAIHDPKYFKGEAWDGGMNEIARHHLALLGNAGVRGQIILGGWSMGGLLAITMSHILAQSPPALFSVVGIVLIDTPYNIPLKQLQTEAVEPDLSHLPPLTQQAFKNCDTYLENWEPPSWTTSACDGKPLTLMAGKNTFNVNSCQALYLPLSGDWKLIKGATFVYPKSSDTTFAPPPGVLIRAMYPTPRPLGASGACTIDQFRHDPFLGWSERYAEFIKATMDVDSDHFNMFDIKNKRKLEKLTEKLNQGLEILETLAKSG